MLKFNYHSMPKYFTSLLMSNMQPSSENFLKLSNTISNNAGFNAIVRQSFRDVDERSNLKLIITSLGWTGFRNRLGCCFVEYLHKNRFPTHPDLDYIHDVLVLTEKLNEYSLGGYSRHFLLGLYLKFDKIEKGDKGIGGFFDDKVVSLLKYTSQRTIPIDWVMICLAHFSWYLGHDKLDSLLKFGTSYKEIYTNLTEAQKEEFCENCLKYASSINEEKYFY